MSGLTKPQAAQLIRALRADGSISPRRRSETRVMGNLVRQGLLDGGFNEGFYISRSGLAALLHFRMMEDVRSGSIASMENVEEVRAAIAKATQS